MEQSPEGAFLACPIGLSVRFSFSLEMGRNLGARVVAVGIKLAAENSSLQEHVSIRLLAQKAGVNRDMSKRLRVPFGKSSGSSCMTPNAQLCLWTLFV